MISSDLLQILRCPLTGQPVALASVGMLERANASLPTGAVPFTGALVREDQKVLYPIRDGIPVLLAEEAVTLP